MDVFIIKSVNTTYSDISIINAVMDEDNIICWDREENAKTFLNDNLYEENFNVVKKELDVFRREIEKINKDNHTSTALKVINTVDY